MHITYLSFVLAFPKRMVHGTLQPGVVHSEKSVRHNSRIESCLGCIWEAWGVVLCTKSSILLVWNGELKISSVACGFSSIRISRINVNYICFNKIYFILLNQINNINLIYNRLLCCHNNCCLAAITLVVCVTSASRYITSASCFTRVINIDPRCTSVVWFHGIPRNAPRQFRLGVVFSTSNLAIYSHEISQDKLPEAYNRQSIIVI